MKTRTGIHALAFRGSVRSPMIAAPRGGRTTSSSLQERAMHPIGTTQTPVAAMGRSDERSVGT
jgi:hypothetical protein